MPQVERHTSGLITGGPDELFRLQHPVAERRFQKKVQIPDSLSPKEILQLPLLFEGEKRIRFNPTYGGIFIKRYRTRRRKKEMDINQDEQGIQESFPIDIGKKTKLEVEPEWPQLGTVENAIKTAKHIVEENSVDSHRVKKLESTLQLTHYLFEAFTSGEITDENLREYLGTGYEMLQQSGMLRPGSPNREDAVEQIVSALDKDSLGRFNPLISKTRLASASIKLLYENLVAGQTVQKYTYLLNALLYVERESERMYLEQILRQSLLILNLSPNNPVFKQFRDALQENAFQLLGLDVMKVAPYRRPALWYLMYVFGYPDGIERGDYRYVFGKSFTRESMFEIGRIHENDDDSPESNQKFLDRLQSASVLIQEVLEFGEKELNKPSKSKKRRSSDSQGIV